MRALDHVDGVELDAAHVLREAREALRGEPAGKRTIEVLAGDEEPGDGAGRDVQRLQP
jgi:hypothetical protein